MNFTFRWNEDKEVLVVPAQSWAEAWRKFWADHPETIGYVRGYAPSGMWVCDSVSYPRRNFHGS